MTIILTFLLVTMLKLKIIYSGANCFGGLSLEVDCLCVPKAPATNFTSLLLIVTARAVKLGVRVLLA